MFASSSLVCGRSSAASSLKPTRWQLPASAQCSSTIAPLDLAPREYQGGARPRICSALTVPLADLRGVLIPNSLISWPSAYRAGSTCWELPALLDEGQCLPEDLAEIRSLAPGWTCRGAAVRHLVSISAGVRP